MFLFEELSVANQITNNIETIDSTNSISNNQLAPLSDIVNNNGIYFKVLFNVTIQKLF